MPIIIDKENVNIAPRQEETPLSVLNGDMCEEKLAPVTRGKNLYKMFVEMYQ